MSAHAPTPASPLPKSTGVGSQEATNIVYRELLNPHHETTYPGKPKYFGQVLMAFLFVPLLAAAIFVGWEALFYGLGQVGAKGMLGTGWMATDLWPTLLVVIQGGIWVHVMIAFISVFAMYAIWMERKVSAKMQCRTGPLEHGLTHLKVTVPKFLGGKTYNVRIPILGWIPKGMLHGWAQTLADGLKLLGKEDLVPKGADALLFGAAPVVAFLGVFAGYAVLPFHGAQTGIATNLPTAVYFLAAVTSVEVIGVVLAGWGSNNKWSLFGGMRAATQMVSYELPLGLSLLTVIVATGTLNIQEIIADQHLHGVGALGWNVFRSPLLFLGFFIYFVAALAECKRAPFDLPEAESELISGFHTEYSAMRFSIFFLAEYASMYVVAAFAAAAYLGGWLTGIPAIDEQLRVMAEQNTLVNNCIVAAVGTMVITGKAMILIFFQMSARWTYPRLRLDQIMYTCLKVLLPAAMVVLVAATAWEWKMHDRVFFGFFESENRMYNKKKDLEARAKAAEAADTPAPQPAGEGK
jgi:NADH-quinone oxidoreductase subunit H